MECCLHLTATSVEWMALCDARPHRDKSRAVMHGENSLVHKARDARGRSDDYCPRSPTRQSSGPKKPHTRQTLVVVLVDSASTPFGHPVLDDTRRTMLD